MGYVGWRGIKKGKWDNGNSIINKIYLKNNKKFISCKYINKQRTALYVVCKKLTPSADAD